MLWIFACATRSTRKVNSSMQRKIEKCHCALVRARLEYKRVCTWSIALPLRCAYVFLWGGERGGGCTLLRTEQAQEMARNERNVYSVWSTVRQLFAKFVIENLYVTRISGEVEHARGDETEREEKWGGGQEKDRHLEKVMAPSKTNSMQWIIQMIVLFEPFRMPCKW